MDDLDIYFRLREFFYAIANNVHLTEDEVNTFNEILDDWIKVIVRGAKND